MNYRMIGFAIGRILLVEAALLLSFDMLVGRLEIFPILVMFSARTWRRD